MSVLDYVHFLPNCDIPHRVLEPLIRATIYSVQKKYKVVQIWQGLICM